MEEVHSAASRQILRIGFSSYVYESLALTSVREEDKCILGADKDHKPINKNVRTGSLFLMSDTNLYESSSLPSEPPDIANWFLAMPMNHRPSWIQMMLSTFRWWRR
ncbi:Uncharacterized protein Rs2_49773 [Raphanus sativus]|nr:Uncharacterized protein Rs2_49773 [Raphanus sativus]